MRGSIEGKAEKTKISKIDALQSLTFDVYTRYFPSTEKRPRIFQHPAQKKHINYELERKKKMDTEFVFDGDSKRAGNQ